MIFPSSKDYKKKRINKKYNIFLDKYIMYVLVKGYCYHTFNVGFLKNYFRKEGPLSIEEKNEIASQSIESNFNNFTHPKLGSFYRTNIAIIEGLCSNIDNNALIVAKIYVQVLFYSVKYKEVITYTITQVSEKGIEGRFLNYNLDCPINLISTGSCTYNATLNVITTFEKVRLKQKDRIRCKVTSFKQKLDANYKRISILITSCRNAWFGKLK